jgi:uncharacterized protein (DUF885 family)
MKLAVVSIAIMGWLTMPGEAVAGQEPAGHAATEDAKLAAFFKDYLETALSDQPMFATRLGDHRFDARLDDLSAGARRALLKRDKEVLAELPRSIAFERLSADGKVDFEVMRQDLERSIWLTETFDPFVDDPRVWGGYLTESVYALLTQSTLPKATNIENAFQRMKAIPRVVAIARETIGNPPRVKAETAIAQTAGAIDFYESEFATIAGLAKDDARLTEAKAPVIAALRDHLAFLKSAVLPRSEPDNWRIGKKLFDRKLELELDAGLTADEVLREAESEASRVESEMAVIARQLWSSFYPTLPIPPDDAVGRREMIRKVLAKIGDNRSTTESVLADVQSTVSKIKTFIREKKILSLPEPDLCAIIEMPEFMRGNSTAYLNPAPPLDPKARSEYAVSPPPADWTPERAESYFREYNKQMLRILSIHEGYPGHYVQLEYSNRCPSLIRRVLGSGTFAEGWAVYTEQMMLDQGYGDGDLALRLQQLKFYLRAVVNAILDNKMHCQNLSDADAMELLAGRAFQTEGEAVGKIVRSKQSACQLSTYFVGRTAFYRLRQAIQREQGDDFELAKFHEAVLSHGTVPVKHLPGLVRRSLAIADQPGAAVQAPVSP